MGGRWEEEPFCGFCLMFKIVRVSLLIIRVQRVNRKRDFHCIVHSTYDGLGLNFKGQVKRERASWMLALIYWRNCSFVWNADLCHPAKLTGPWGVRILECWLQKLKLPGEYFKRTMSRLVYPKSDLSFFFLPLRSIWKVHVICFYVLKNL